MPLCIYKKQALKKQDIKTLKPLISQRFQVSVSILVTQYVCVAPNGVQRRVFALNGVRGDSINVFPMIPMRGACPSCTTSLYLPDVFCSNRFCGFFESLEVLACFNLKHKACPCFPRGTKGAFPISFYLVSDIGIVSIFARRAQEPDFFIIPL